MLLPVILLDHRAHVDRDGAWRGDATRLQVAPVATDPRTLTSSSSLRLTAPSLIVVPPVVALRAELKYWYLMPCL